MTVATQPAPTRAPVPVLPPPVRSRFTPLVAGSPRLTGWLGPIGIGLLALAMRVWNLGYPRSVLFDETYYAKDAYALTQFGYVQDYKESANGDILDGILTGLWTGEPTQVVHPDGGKWMIAIGEQIFGMTPFGWRISAAVVGALMVVVIARLVRRLTGSTLLGCVAGLLLCFDGMHFVMSRLALLDIFLAFWLLCAVACLVTDRDWGRVRLVAAEQPAGRWGPLLLVRPWRLAAGVCFGMACGTKWSALWFIAVFGLLTYAWDTGARRAIGVRAAWLKSALVDGLPAFLSIVGVAFVVYLLTWTGWLLHHDVYEQRFAFGYGDDPPWGSYLDTPATTWFGQSVEALRSLWHYHLMVFDFHTGDYLEGKTHPYGSQPQGWLLLSRPVGVEAQNDLPEHRRLHRGGRLHLPAAGADPGQPRAVVERRRGAGDLGLDVGTATRLALRCSGPGCRSRMAPVVPLRRPPHLLVLRDRLHSVHRRRRHPCDRSVPRRPHHRRATVASRRGRRLRGRRHRVLRLLLSHLQRPADHPRPVDPAHVVQPLGLSTPATG
ncbi:MAG: phospholipid carrier-dependent glycosyltransferase [Nocardioidaceae bacterium]